MRQPLLLLLIGVLLLSGCIQEDFYQKVERDGRSVIRVQFDFTQFLALAQERGSQYGVSGLSEGDFVLRLQEACSEARAKDASITCQVNGSRLMMGKTFDARNPYYTFEAQEGIPYRTYRLTVNRLPLDRLTLPAPNLTGPAAAAQAPAQALDLTNKSDSARVAQGLSIIQGFRLTYSVEMPADIETATAGPYQAQRDPSNPHVATFDMVEVLSDSEPLVVESRELNILPIVALVAFALLVLVSTLYFLGVRKR